MYWHSTRVAVAGLCLILGACGRAPDPVVGTRPPAGAREPKISPDGTQIALSLGGAIGVMPAAGGVVRQVTTGTGNDRNPIWSPDGTTLAFLSDRSGSNQLWSVPVAGGQPRQLTSDRSGKSDLSWSPDGTLIAFTTGAGRFASRVRAVALADLSLRDLIEADAHYPVWSPDGSRLAFVRRNEQRNYDLWTMPAAGGPAVRVTNGEGMEIQPAWSPDGRQIAYTSYTYVAAQPGATDLFLVPADGGAPRRLTETEWAEFDPTWTKDGRSLVFTSNVSGNTELQTIPISGGDAAPLRPTGLAFAAGAGGQLNIAVTEGARPVPSRISVQGSDGKFYADGRRFFRTANDRLSFFHTDGSAVIDLPAGPAKVWVARGPEYRVVERTVEIPPGGTRDLAIQLERWIDMTADKWYSGDNHVHANYSLLDYRNTPEDILLMAQAEDLNVTNLLVANFGGTPSFDWVEGFWDQQFFEGKPSGLSRGRTILYWNSEMRSTVFGHMTLINLKTLVEPLQSGFRGTPNVDDYPPNADIADRAHLQGGVVSYVHPFIASQDTFKHYDAAEFNSDWRFDPGYAALELPVDLALGKIDALDLATRFDTFEQTAVVYGRLLNCGFRLTAAAGTDVYSDQKRNPPVGIERMYVHSLEPFSYAAYIGGMKAGRTFVTNGPMLSLTVNGQSIGGTVKIDRAGTVNVKASATGQFPIDRMEILVNGRVAETVRASGDRLSVTYEGSVQTPHSAWIAVRVDGPRHPMLLSGNPLAAHSSPVYVLVGDEPIASATDAKFFITWIDKVFELVDRRDRWTAPAHRQSVRDLFTRAQDVYRRIAASDPTTRRMTSR